MADFNELGDTQLGADRILTSPTMQALYNNPIAIAEGAAGAPRIVNAALQNHPWSRGDLKTTSGTISAGSAENWHYRITLPGGQYGFFPQYRVTKTSGNWENDSTAGLLLGIGHMSGSGYEVAPRPDAQSLTSYGAYVECWNGNNIRMQARQRYIQSSPPYDLGSGEIPLFVFATITPDGAIGSLYIAEDPPWYNNGPTRLTPDAVDPQTGRQYLRRRTCCLTMDDVRESRCDLQDLIAARREATEEWVEITTALKNTDMPLIPHPFLNPQPDDTLALLDPTSDLVDDLRQLNAEGEDVASLILDYMRVGDEIDVATPPGVKALALRWKGGK